MDVPLLTCFTVHATDRQNGEHASVLAFIYVHVGITCKHCADTSCRASPVQNQMQQGKLIASGVTHGDYSTGRSLTLWAERLAFCIPVASLQVISCSVTTNEGSQLKSQIQALKGCKKAACTGIIIVLRIVEQRGKMDTIDAIEKLLI
eukprot:scaffold137871_cov21-Tisochrysis_lutea.AAC.3